MNTEIIMKAKEAKSAEELVKIARENGLELSQSGAEQLFGELHRPSGELRDSELESAVGFCGLRDYFAKDTRFDVTQIIGDGLGGVKEAGEEKLGSMTVGLTNSLNKITGDKV